MKSILKSIVLCTSLLAVLAACSPQEKEVPKKVKVTVNEQMQADELTAAGEQLIAPHTLHLADRAFALALEKNPSDRKAQFYRAFLKRFMVLRGIGKNIRPFAQANGELKPFEKEIKKMPRTPLNDFVLVPENGTAKPIYNEEDLQKVLISYREALQDFRSYVVANQDLKLDLNVNLAFFMSSIQDKLDSNCTVSEGASSEEDTIECDNSEFSTVKLNVADLIAMKQEAAGEILYLTLYTSYNLNGLAKLAQEQKDQESTSKKATELLLQKVNLKLLNKDSMTAVRTLGADLAIAANWVLKYQDTICPTNEYGQKTYRSGYVVTSDLCIEDSTQYEKNVAMLEKILSGSVAAQMETNDGEQITKNLNILAPFIKPAADLRAWAPATWNSTESAATSFKDKTLGGLFPDGDANLDVNSVNLK